MSEQPCSMANKECWGEVALYSFDIDLPTIWLCKGHVLSFFTGAPPHVKMQAAEELEGLDD